MKSIHDYSDIINMPRPDPKRHLRMPISDRAAQFSPFAALTGFSGVIDEVGRNTEEKIILDEKEKDRINRILTLLKSEITRKPVIKITAFVPDAKKEGGSYQTFKGGLLKIDEFKRNLILTNGLKLNFDDIIRIEKEN